MHDKSNHQSNQQESVQQAIERLRANRHDNKISENKAFISVNSAPAPEYKIESQVTSRVENRAEIPTMSANARASKNAKPIDTLERQNAIHSVIKKLMFEEITQGQALKELRLIILGLKQQDYADLVGVSRKTLSDVENDRGKYKTDILDKLFKPFGLKVGLVPVSVNLLENVLGE